MLPRLKFCVVFTFLKNEVKFLTLVFYLLVLGSLYGIMQLFSSTFVVSSNTAFLSMLVFLWILKGKGVRLIIAFLDVLKTFIVFI